MPPLVISKPLATLLVGTLAVSAHAATAVYVLKDVTFTASAINGNPVQPPFTPPTAKMTGIFVWTYSPGDFANGTGNFTEVTIPWTYYGLGPSTISSNSYGQYLSFAIDPTSLNGTLAGPSVHSQGIDFQINLSPVLSDPSQGTGIGTSANSFDIWGADGNEYTGSTITGSIVPFQPMVSLQRSGTNVVVHWPTNYADGFVVETASTLGTNLVWTTSTPPIVVTGTNYSSTNIISGSKSGFFRLIR